MRARWGSIAFAIVVGCGGGTTTPDSGGVDAGGDAGRGDLGAMDTGPPGCTDADHDGHMTPPCGDDCDDGDANAYPGHTEVCDATGHDEDCDPTTLGADADADGFVSDACCNTQSDGMLRCGRDCNDGEANIHPGAPESCNGVDDDCNGATDDGLVSSPYYPDCDGDGYGDAAATARMACALPTTALPCTGTAGTGAAWVMSGTDCDDTLRPIHPGALTPCDCASGAHAYDADGDGMATTACGGRDCDDGAATVYDGAPELCDGRQDDCSAASWTAEDQDGDGHLAAASTCSGGPLGSAPRDDCDDTMPDVHPGALDCAADGLDQDCSGADGDTGAASCDAPGVVMCGTMPAAACLAPAECCAHPIGSAYAGSCIAGGGTCGGSIRATLSCDGPEDCGSGMGCCFTLVGGSADLACGPTPCSTTACHTDADCGTGNCREYVAGSGVRTCTPAVSASTPGAVACGMPLMTCPLPADHCCIAVAIPAGTVSCTAVATACTAGTLGTGTVNCDGPEDCGSGQNCCASMPTSTTASTSCSATSCQRVCHRDADCGGGVHCNAYAPSGFPSGLGVCAS